MHVLKRFTQDLANFMLTVGLLSGLLLAGCSKPQTGAIIDYGAPILGVVVDEKVVILGVEVGSAAERAGLQIGDQLETLNDVAFATQRQKAKDLIHNFTAGSPALALKLVRNGQEITIEVTPGGIQWPANRPNKPPPPTVTPVPPQDDYF